MKKEENKVECELQDELHSLKRKNRRHNMFLILTALQIGAAAISYYLGRSHK